MTFKSDLEFGKASEDVLERRLRHYGYDTFRSTTKSADISYQVKVEVKSDRVWRTTGNVAVEYASSGVPSGISTTDADIYVYVLDGIDAFWYCGVGELKEYLKNIKTKKVKGGDGERTSLILLTLSQFHAIFKRV